MNAEQLLDKWARMKLLETYLDEDQLPPKDVLISVDFETMYGGYCETCSYEEDVIQLRWNGTEYTLYEYYDLKSIINEALELLDTDE